MLGVKALVHTPFVLVGVDARRTVLAEVRRRAPVRRPRVRLRIKRHHFLGDVADARGRNNVARKRHAREGIADVHTFAAEIAVLHKTRRHRVLHRALARKPHRLPCEIEERLVFAVIQLRDRYRTANGAAERVADLRRQHVLPVGARIARLVLVLPEQRAVIVVPSAL